MQQLTVDKEFNGRVALITGASSGIGQAAAERLAAAGAAVAITGRQAEPLQALAAQIQQAGGQALAVVGDLQSDPHFPKALMEATLSRFGRLDILINSAGTLGMGTIETTTMAAWDAMMQLNVRVVFELMQLAIPYLTQTTGNIVNVSSVTGLRSFPGVLAYCVSKAAVDQLTRCSALELAARGIRVNAVNPGVVVTKLHRAAGMSDEAYQAFLDHSRTTHPLGRAGTTAEVAELICFLASARAAWITGATYAIDGGRTLTCAR
jgi:NAD(P)-dependent dehydrogenase (short-subunit alcohol dehydrogenase family)